MTDIKPILQSLAGGASPHGLSNYTAEYTCSRRVYLDLLEDWPQRFDIYSSALRGIIGHKFMELHLGRVLPSASPPMVIEFSELVDEKARFEAERAFVAFQERFPDPKHWGRVEAVEHTLGPSDEIGEAVGIHPYTCRLDAVVWLTTHRIKKIKESIETDGRIEALVPGYWILDWKFPGRREALLLDKTLGSLPYVAYPLAWNATYPKKPVMGCLQVTIICTKETRFLLTVVPFPNKTKQAVLHTFFKQVAEKLATEPERGTPNPFSCFDWSKACPHYVSGKCKRF